MHSSRNKQTARNKKSAHNAYIDCVVQAYNFFFLDIKTLLVFAKSIIIEWYYFTDLSWILFRDEDVGG